MGFQGSSAVGGCDHHAMTKARLARRFLAGLAALVVATVAGPASGSSSEAAALRWQEVPNLELGHGRALAGAGWAAGRAWFLVGSSKTLTVASARARAGGLAGFETTRVNARLSWYPIVLGTTILYPATRTSSAAAPLLASGKLGPAVAADPEPMASKLGVPVAAARLGDRTIWALAGGRLASPEGLNFKPTLAACCDGAGGARNLTSFITASVRSPARGHAMGVDGRGRLWLAWIDGPIARAEARMLQLDPVTLAPLTRKAHVAPVAGVAGPAIRTQDVALACAAACRLVVGSYFSKPSGGADTRVATWAPGETSAATVDLGAASHPSLVAAGFRSGGLAIAYTESSSGEPTLKVVVGDARGARARPAGSIVIPQRSRGVPMYTFFTGAFAAKGFVYAQMYSNFGLRGHVLATVVPLR
jgi:hypothetical protein